MKERFEDINLSKTSLDRLAQVNVILTEYAADGYDLSLRQLYYQLVARDLIENSQKSYKRLGTLVSKGRRAGLVDWSMIVDRGRVRITNSHWNNPAEIVESAAAQFRIDKWADQPWHVEIMVEKQALEGVLVPVCRELDVAFTANKGYSSDSMMHQAGQRIARIMGDNRKVMVIYLGDHDPSGNDMTRDIRERLEMFSYCSVDEVKRIALNMDQIEALRPPRNPAKITDSRYKAYVAEFGTSSWELDAIEPRMLARLVTDTVEALRDDDLWQAAVKHESQMKKELAAFAKAYRENNEE